MSDKRYLGGGITKNPSQNEKNVFHISKSTECIRPNDTTVEDSLINMTQEISNIKQEIINVKQSLANVTITDAVKSEIRLSAYPVGSIYMSTTNVNPGNTIGGTWVEWGSGRVPVGVNVNEAEFNTVEKTGGAKYCALGHSNMPSHAHTLSHTHTTPQTATWDAGSHSHGMDDTWTNAIQVSGNTMKWQTAGNYAGGGTLTPGMRPANSATWTYEDIYVYNPAHNIHAVGHHAHVIPAMTTNSLSTATTSYAGEGAAFGIMQPYITCYMWKRTA